MSTHGIKDNNKEWKGKHRHLDTLCIIHNGVYYYYYYYCRSLQRVSLVHGCVYCRKSARTKDLVGSGRRSRLRSSLLGDVDIAVAAAAAGLVDGQFPRVELVHVLEALALGFVDEEVDYYRRQLGHFIWGTS